MNLTFLACVVCSVCWFITGFNICKTKHIIKCSGQIVMYNDSIYLNIEKEEIEQFKDGNFVTLQIKRRNFKGFNEE